ATVTGIIISSILLVVVGLVIIGAMVSSMTADKETVVADNSLLHIDLQHQITERTIPDPFEELDVPGFTTTKSFGLNDILKGIEGAKNDNRIKGIYLDLSAVSASFATLQEIRDALLDFKTSGKFIVAYSEGYTQRAYYLASTADKVYVNPEGTIDFRGLASQTPFIKGALDKLGVEMQVVKVGTFKSAVEPFILNQMSDPNREQVTSFLGSIYDHFLDQVGASRQLSADSLRTIANGFLVRTADDAVSYGLADGKRYKDELLRELKDSLDIDSTKDVNAVALEKYKPAANTSDVSVRDRIAVVYV